MSQAARTILCTTGKDTQTMSTAFTNVAGVLDAPLQNGDDRKLTLNARVLSLQSRRDMRANGSSQILRAAENDITSNQIVGDSPALKRVLELVEKVAPFDSTVLLLGETGTGKELIANAIHRGSPRRDHTFVRVNCGALPAELIASELFGHERGAFTGAMQQRIGRFEIANGGTIFLDEIAELSPEIQVALLRVLQEREFERVGGNRTIKTDVRVIAATNKDLWREVSEARFRMDLFYRLNVFPVHVPPLRERVNDIPVLVDYFAARLAERTGKKISQIEKRSLCAMQQYSWPGNVRELEHAIERAVIVARGDTIKPRDLPPEISQKARQRVPDDSLDLHTHDSRRRLLRIGLRKFIGSLLDFFERPEPELFFVLDFAMLENLPL